MHRNARFREQLACEPIHLPNSSHNWHGRLFKLSVPYSLLALTLCAIAHRPETGDPFFGPGQISARPHRFDKRKLAHQIECCARQIIAIWPVIMPDSSGIPLADQSALRIMINLFGHRPPARRHSFQMRSFFTHCELLMLFSNAITSISACSGLQWTNQQQAN